MNKIVKTTYLTAVLLAFGMWSGQAAADDVLATGDDVTDAAFANGAVETDVLADERGMSAETGDGGLAIALDVDAGNSVIFADSDSTTDQKAKQKIDIEAGGAVTTITGAQRGNEFSNNRFSIGLFNTGNNVQMGASMNVNVIFAPATP